MIYIWLVISRIMHSYNSYEEYWESDDYRCHVITGDLSYCPVMVEEKTSLWEEQK